MAENEMSYDGYIEIPRFLSSVSLQATKSGDSCGCNGIECSCKSGHSVCECNVNNPCSCKSRGGCSCNAYDPPCPQDDDICSCNGIECACKSGYAFCECNVNNPVPTCPKYILCPEDSGQSAYVGGEKATPYIYNNNSWRKSVAYVYSKGAWKKCSTT